MKPINIIIITLLMFSLIGCNSKINTIKDGTLELDNSITIGDAIDNYKHFSNVKWSNFTTDNKREVVEVYAVLDKSIFILTNIPDEELINGGVINQNTNVYLKCNKAPLFDFIHDQCMLDSFKCKSLKDAYDKTIEINNIIQKKDLSLRIQFVLNKDDTFKIHYAEFSYAEDFSSQLHQNEIYKTFEKIYTQANYSDLAFARLAVINYGKDIYKNLQNEG